MPQEYLEPQVIIYINKHVMECHREVCAKFARACNLGQLTSRFNKKKCNNIVTEEESLDEKSKRIF